MNPPGPLVAWQGWDLRAGGSPEQATGALASSDATPEGAVGPEAYELLAVAARGFRPPRFLTTAPAADEGGTGSGGVGERGGTVLRPAWSLVYRRVAETAPPAVAPYAIYLLGVDPPDDASDEELDTFNEFYTDVHLPEVAERRHALRAERFELVRAVRPPYPGAPRFLAVYEVDEEGAANRRHRGPPYARGPEVWQRHTTPWRLWYRRLGGPGPGP